jgi:hypothetical protein
MQKKIRPFIRKQATRELKNIGRAIAPIQTKLSPRVTRRIVFWGAIKALKKAGIETKETKKFALNLAKSSAEHAKTGNMYYLILSGYHFAQIIKTENSLTGTNEFQKFYGRYRTWAIKMIKKKVAKKAEEN